MGKGTYIFGLPAAAKYSFLGNIFDVDCVHYFRYILLYLQIHQSAWLHKKYNINTYNSIIYLFIINTI